MTHSFDLMKDINILIADDHPVLRKGLIAVFADHPGFTVVGEADNGEKAIEAAVRLKPDVILMDVSMPGLNGIEAARRILERHTGIRVIMLSMHQNTQYALEAFQAGACGYVLKGADSEELIEAVEKAVAGKRYVSPAVADDLLGDYVSKRPGCAEPFDTLSEREKEVLALVAEGAQSKEVADRLQITVPTVNKHRVNIMRKLKVHDLASLIRIAIKKNLVKEPV